MNTNDQEQIAANDRFIELMLKNKSSDLKWSVLLGRLKELRQEYHDVGSENDPDALAVRRQHAVFYALQAVTLYLKFAGCPYEDCVI